MGFIDEQTGIKNYIGQGAASFEAKNTHLSGHTNGPQDAYRHMLGAAEITRRFGTPAARALLNINEYRRLINNPDHEFTSAEYMDFHNNEIGIKIGQYARTFEEAVAVVKILINQGQFVLNINARDKTDVSNLPGVDKNKPVFILIQGENDKPEWNNFPYDESNRNQKFTGPPGYEDPSDPSKVINYTKGTEEYREGSHQFFQIIGKASPLPPAIQAAFDVVRANAGNGGGIDEIDGSMGNDVFVPQPNSAVETGFMNDLSTVDFDGDTYDEIAANSDQDVGLRDDLSELDENFEHPPAGWTHQFGFNYKYDIENGLSVERETGLYVDANGDFITITKDKQAFGPSTIKTTVASEATDTVSISTSRLDASGRLTGKDSVKAGETTMRVTGYDRDQDGNLIQTGTQDTRWIRLSPLMTYQDLRLT